MFRQPHRENRLNRTGGDIGENAGIANALFGNLFRGLTFLRANTTRVVLCATDNPSSSVMPACSKCASCSVKTSNWPCGIFRLCEGVAAASGELSSRNFR